MSYDDFYYITDPSEWATQPPIYSYSSLRQIECCPLAWQLLNSRYDGFNRYPTRQNPVGVEGEIIHCVLENLFRCLAQQGMPSIGSELFQQSIKRLNVSALISQLVTDHITKIAQHPRGSGFRIKSGVMELQNKVIRIFREQYDKIRNNAPVSMMSAIRETSGVKKYKKDSSDYKKILSTQGVLTEISLRHPSLPFKGVIDFVWQDENGAGITDFKSGITKAEHIEQVLIYALLWEQNTGDLPCKAYVVYPDVSIPVDINRNSIDATHNDLKKRIANARVELSSTPARAIVNDNCRYCQVRQMCNCYWQLQESQLAALNSGYVDIEVIVKESQNDFGFTGTVNNYGNINVVYEKEAAKVSGPFRENDKLRIIGAVLGKDALEIKTWTEVFHCNQNLNN